VVPTKKPHENRSTHHNHFLEPPMPLTDAYQSDAYAAFTHTVDATDSSLSNTPVAPTTTTDAYSEFLSRIDD
jgi:hypothetical protein